MATYVELYDGVYPTLTQQILVALCVKADSIAKDLTATAEQKQFAVQALTNPITYLSVLKNYILAEYNTASIEVINAATDEAVQTAVDAAVDTLLGV